MTLAGEVGAFPAITVPSDADTQRAAQVMRDEAAGDVIVVDTEGKVVGVVTDRDLTVRVIAAGRDPASTKVGEVMTPDPTTVDALVEVEEAERIMRERLVHRLPVVDRDGTPLGMLSLEDLAASGYVADKDLREVMKSIARAYQLRSPSIP
jgi:signal-transduction protein with cAMP-binding, CBS, and nucleotidyltransferase domain